MKETQIFTRIEQECKLSALPEILAEVIKATEDRNASLESIAKVISKDVALTGKLLRVSNSSFYGRPNKVGSVRDAIGVLGTRTVKSIALSISVYDLCSRLENSLDIREFWRHSLEVAIVSELIAKKLKERFAEEAFVCGLLHDVGIPILDSVFPTEYQRVWQLVSTGAELISSEEAVVGTNHAAVGSFIAEKWNLPKTFANAILDHHRAFNVNEEEEQETLAQIIGLASRIGSYSLNGLSYNRRSDFENRRILIQNLKLTNEDIAQIQSESTERLIETAEFLEMDVGSPLDLVQKANHLLFQLVCQIEALYSTPDPSGDGIPQRQLDYIATDVMHTVVATFSHYFNNACATILGRSQLMEMALNKNQLKDTDNQVLRHSIDVIQRGVESISNVLSVMKSVESFDTIEYHESAKIIDLKEQLDNLTASKLEPVQQRK